MAGRTLIRSLPLRMLLVEVTLSGCVFVLAQAFMALGRPGMVTLLQAAGLSISIPIMILLVPRWGIAGAALALLVSTTARFLLVLASFPMILKVSAPSLIPTKARLCNPVAWAITVEANEGSMSEMQMADRRSLLTARIALSVDAPDHHRLSALPGRQAADRSFTRSKLRPGHLPAPAASCLLRRFGVLALLLGAVGAAFDRLPHLIDDCLVRDDRSLPGLLRRLSDLSQQFIRDVSFRTKSWLYVVAAVFYGAVVGILQNPLAAVVQDILGWTAPICMALYLYAQREHARELLGTLRSSFLYGTLLMAVYGLYQFFYLAPWDAFWMENSGLNSIGLPEPLQVRVFSTMNLPQPLAEFLICCVFLSMTSTRRIRFLAIPLGLLVTGLTMSRSSWISAVIGIIIISLAFTSRQRMQIAALLLLCVVLVGGASQIPEVNELITRRLESFSNLHEDTSVNDRVESQRQAIAAFQSSPFGLGLGAGAHRKNEGPSYGVPPQSIEIGDNGLEQVLLSFGCAEASSSS